MDRPGEPAVFDDAIGPRRCPVCGAEIVGVGAVVANDPHPFGTRRRVVPPSVTADPCGCAVRIETNERGILRVYPAKKEPAG